MKKIKYFLYATVMIFYHTANAQITKQDSIYLNTCMGEPMWVSYWNYPGNWMTQPEISSVQNMYDQMNEMFVFENEDYIDCYQNMVVDTFMQYETIINDQIALFEQTYAPLTVYNLPKPIRKVGFTLNNKTGYASALLDSVSNISGNRDIAFVIITGTGSNQIKPIVDNVGYHNTNCQTMNLLKTRGDVYVMSIPNEDYRAIYFNKKKLKYLPTPNMMVAYLNSINKAPGVSRLVEHVAMIKYLKTKYKKVFVLGLSTGGKVAHWVSMMSEPDATIVSSGYSVLVDNDYQSQLVNATLYGPYLTIYTPDSIKNKTKQLRTQFLITQANGDVALIQKDIDSGYTKKYFQDVNNISYFYDYVNHAFPPCFVIDSFFNRCTAIPKIFAKYDTKKCNTDSMKVNLSFYGKAPIQYALYKDTQWIANYTASTLEDSLILFNEGNYIIKNIVDSLGNIGYYSDTIFYKKHPQIGFQFSNLESICDTNISKIQYSFQGMQPWYLTYKYNASTYVDTFTHTTDSLYLNNGTYEYLSISDGNTCSINLNNTLSVAHEKLIVNYSSPVYNCDSNKSHIHFTFSGDAPYTVYYTMDGMPMQKVSNSPTFDMYLSNGLYQFLQVKDNSQCSKTINAIFNFNYTPLTIQKNNYTYICDSNKVKYDYTFTGNGPWQIHYKDLNTMQDYVNTYNNNNASLYLPTGNYAIFQVNDTKCNQIFNDTLFVNFPSLQGTVSDAYISCDSSSAATSIQFSSAKYPVSLQYNYNGNLFYKVFNNPQQAWILPNGNYYMISYKDSVGCTQLLNKAIVANYVPISFISFDKKYLCEKDSTEITFNYLGSGINYFVYSHLETMKKDTIVLNNNFKWLPKSGNNYMNYIYNEYGCIDSINQNVFVHNEHVALENILCTPICTEKYYKTSFKLTGQSPWTLYYIQKNQWSESTFVNSNSEVSLLPDNYNFVKITDANNCIATIDTQFVLNKFIDFTLKINTDYYTIHAPSSSYMHSWYKDNIEIQGEKKSSILIAGSGDYFVKVIDSSGCEYYSDTITINFPTQVNIYPNPAGNYLNVMIDNGNITTWKYAILDIAGKKVLEGNSNGKMNKVDVKNLSAGVYTIKIEDSYQSLKHISKFRKE